MRQNTPWEVRGHEGDPLFVNPGMGDFRVLPGSPAIDGGVDLAELPHDSKGVQRPQGVRTDVGPFER
ncbi:MAG: hypothetical protein GY711_07730 [bacterium]|nr:hypothetical protein [bacterium]